MRKRILAGALLLALLLCASCGKKEAPPTTTAVDNTVTVMFPEGTTVWQAAKLLEENGVCTAEAFLTYVQSGDWAAEIAADTADRPFRAEGYLFPDTYEFYKDSSPAGALDKFLSNLFVKWTDEMQSRADKLGMTQDQTLTLASIIQTEAGYADEMPHVSSVLHNRLKQNIMLQCDVTYFYLKNAVMPYLCGEVWVDSVYEQYADLYYTYRFVGLPEGPICNPGLAAINAALYPSETDDLFFVTDANGKFYYAATHAEHQRNCEIAKNVVGKTTETN